MKTKLSNWGNSLAVRLPRSVLHEAGVQSGDPLEVECIDGVIHLKPKKKRLDDLLEGVTPGMFSEDDWGGDVGAEILDE